MNKPARASQGQPDSVAPGTARGRRSGRGVRAARPGAVQAGLPSPGHRPARTSPPSTAPACGPSCAATRAPSGSAAPSAWSARTRTCSPSSSCPASTAVLEVYDTSRPRAPSRCPGRRSGCGRRRSSWWRRSSGAASARRSCSRPEAQRFPGAPDARRRSSPDRLPPFVDLAKLVAAAAIGLLVTAVSRRYRGRTSLKRSRWNRPRCCCACRAR